MECGWRKAWLAPKHMQARLFANRFADERREKSWPDVEAAPRSLNKRNQLLGRARLSLAWCVPGVSNSFEMMALSCKRYATTGWDAVWRDL